MEIISPKDLAKLAAACRKAGITQFKGGGIEFTLSDAPPAPKAAHKAPSEPQGEPENDDLPYEALLNWSVPDFAEEKKADSNES